MTDKEIIKALELCGKDPFYCVNCPFYKNHFCREELREKSLDLINRQQAEKDELFGKNEQLKAEIERLQRELETKNGLVLEIFENKSAFERVARVKAIKEFADEIHEEVRKALDNNYTVRNQRIERNLADKRAETCDDVVHYVEGKIDALRGIDGFVCDYVKEMVGEQE
jgi:hypothetical protein